MTPPDMCTGSPVARTPAARSHSPPSIAAAGYAASRVRPDSSAGLRPAGSRKPSLTWSMRKSVSRPSSSRSAQANMADSTTPSRSPKSQDAPWSAARSPLGSRAPSACAHTSARAVSWRRSAASKSSMGPGQHASSAPSVAPATRRGSAARAPPRQRPISGVLSSAGCPAGHQTHRRRGRPAGSASSSPDVCAATGSPRGPNPAWPASCRPPSGSCSQSATAIAPAGARA